MPRSPEAIFPFVRRALPLIFTLAAYAAACKSPAAPANPPTPVDASKPTVTARFTRPDKDMQESFQLEVARTPAEREQGLMYRQKMDPGQGMLFIFDDDAPRAFWMKNTYIPLDIIFLDRDFTVTGTVEFAEPLTLTARRVDAPSRYVIELVAGTVARLGVKPGDRWQVELPNP